MEQAERAPEFRSEKQAQRIIGLLMRHANDIALTLSHDAAHYEPLFSQNHMDDKVVTIIDEWCCGYVKGMSLDAKLHAGVQGSGGEARE